LLKTIPKALPPQVVEQVEKIAEKRSASLEASLSKAMQEIDDGLRRVRTTLSAIARWQKRAKRIQKRITWRDHPELAPEKKVREKKVTRSIRLPGDKSEMA
jgi:hypothetical protein